GAMHIVMHAFGKITLFFCAGAILVAAHKTRVSELDGIGRDMPWTLGAFFLAALSIAGLPPMGGVWSKWFLVLGTIESGYFVLLAVLLISTLLNIWYLLEIPVRAFFRPAGAQARGGEAPLSCLLAIGVTATASFLLFLFPGPLYRAAAQLVE
ncbi:MAG: monovalent cation/H+ antiporter subunit D family protein, partial [Proteobacteria bacterium]